MVDGTKRCSVCRALKPVEQFYRNRTSWSSQCKACNTEYKRLRYHRDPEHYKAAVTRYTQRRRAAAMAERVGA